MIISFQYICDLLHTQSLGLRQVKVEIQAEREAREGEDDGAIGIEIFLQRRQQWHHYSLTASDTQLVRNSS